jgi:hypothetical protein
MTGWQLAALLMPVMAFAFMGVIALVERRSDRAPTRGAFVGDLYAKHASDSLNAELTVEFERVMTRTDDVLSELARLGRLSEKISQQFRAMNPIATPQPAPPRVSDDVQ